MSFYKKINGVTKIQHHDLIRFLGEKGFKMMLYSKGRKQLIKVSENIIESATEGDLITCIKDFLIKKGKFDVLEIFTRGVNTYTATKKLEFLPVIKSISHKDPKDYAMFYYSNTAVKITAGTINLVPYSKLKHPIWKNRILNREFNMPVGVFGQFYEFIYLVSGTCYDRMTALRTALGYLSHRYNNPSEPKAIIFIDEKISFDGTANGGTGKGLLALALGYCVNLETIDGQQLKGDSRFKNQRIDNTTDIVLFDDVSRKFTLDEIKSMITSGITVEKKGKDEIHISSKDAPKFLINSNHIVLGSGGSTDKRRRCEFEIADYFNDVHRPVDEFNNLFFDEWDENEWNLFDFLMMENVQLFLQYGLLEASPINLTKNKLICCTNPDFGIFSNMEFPSDTWLSKDFLYNKFILDYPFHKNMSSHQFTKWVKEYGKVFGLLYESKNPGGVQQFILKSNLIQSENEKGGEDTSSL